MTTRVIHIAGMELSGIHYTVACEFNAAEGPSISIQVDNQETHGMSITEANLLATAIKTAISVIKEE
ncbi:hypothetical protein [Burkholderia phage vB_BpP_HN04]|nr:hypothetical protein [Burkholderia phage vB_BpP_HN01]